MIRTLFNFGALILISFIICNVCMMDEFNNTLENDFLLLNDNKTALSRSIRETNDGVSSLGNIRFSVPDLNVMHEVNGINVDLQAYKVDDRDRNDQWVSIGQPVLLKNRNGSVYEFTSENIVLRLQLLSHDQLKALKNAAKIRNPNLNEAFIHLIPLQSITCKAVFFSNGHSVELQGKGTNLNQYQIPIKVPCLKNSEQRQNFISRIQKPDPLEWDCTFTADGKEKFVNRIEISARDIQTAVDELDLFGPRDQIYVMRQQMTMFSQEIRSNLQIEEDYELDEKFDEKLVERLISMASSAFQFVSIDQALEKISKFGFSQKDVQPDEIKRQLSDEMVADKSGQKASISVKSDTKQANEGENEYRGSGTGEVSWASLFNVKANGEVLKKNRGKWEKANMSVKDQLNEMNKDSQIHTKYEWDGSKIVPKAIKVALLHKNAFTRNIAVSYKKIVRKDARYRKQISITTGSFIADETLKNINKRMDAAHSSIRSLTRQLEEISISRIVYRTDTAYDTILSLRRSQNSIENRLKIQEQKGYFSNYKVQCNSYSTFSIIVSSTTQIHCPDNPAQNFLHSVQFNIGPGKSTSDIKFPPISWQCCHYVFS